MCLIEFIEYKGRKRTRKYEKGELESERQMGVKGKEMEKEVVRYKIVRKEKKNGKMGIIGKEM